jgi:cysteinyl-tRNA synthetase
MKFQRTPPFGKSAFVAIGVFGLVLISLSASANNSLTRGEMLKDAQTWMYQIQDLDQEGALSTLAATDYPLLVIEPGHNFSEYPYDTTAIVQALRTTPNGARRLLLAYIDIGQAEDYRSYWGSNWVAPTATQRGSPDFLITIDPDGWSGNYPVAYWRTEWKNIWIGSSGIIAQLATYGFDGIYLDWVEAYDDDQVRAAATQEGKNPEEEMILFIEELRQAGRAITPDFLVVPQNAPYLLDTDAARYGAAIDALAVEDTWFHGAGDANWDDPDAGDLQERHEDEWSSANRLTQYRKYQNLGLPVFSVDYCISQTNAASVYQQAWAAGLRPLVTRVSLSRLTVTGPSDFGGPPSIQNYFSGLSLNLTEMAEAGDSVTFSASAASFNQSNLYYRFDLIPNYGTADYDPNTNYTTVRNFSTQAAYSHTFTTAGSYIMVVWVSSTQSISSGAAPIIGGAISIGDNGSIAATGLSMDLTGTTQTGDSVTFTASGLDSNGNDIYYQFYLIPNYGTSNYDPINVYQAIQSFSTATSCTYTFNTSGSYVVVIWMSSTPSIPSGAAPIIGGSITVN